MPFEHQLGDGLPLFEVQRVIRETDPPTPSTRLKRKSGTATALAPLHGTDERSLVRQLTGDLDWIRLMALEKDPARRYRTRKFVRRNPVGLAAGLLVLAGTAAGSTGFLSGRVEASASEPIAEAMRPQADACNVRRLIQSADELWPPYPERIGELEAWQARARQMVHQAQAYSSELAELRARAQPWSAEDRRGDRERHPRAEELAGMRGELAERMRGIEDGTFKDMLLQASEAPVARLEPAIDELELQVSARRTWRFDSESDAALHDLLTGLVEGLRVLQDDLLDPRACSQPYGWSVSRRLACARELGAGMLEGGGAAAAWSEVLPRIRAAYPELDLGPQRGLLPVGPDPRSGLWEFAHLQSGPAPERGAGGELVFANDGGLVLVLIPGGRFLMGAQARDPSAPNYDPGASRGNREGPPIEVDVPAFLLSKFEMTPAQWELCSGENPSIYQLGSGIISVHKPRKPVNQVTWTECQALMGRLGLELPSEEQWEYAARAGTTTPRWTDAGSVPLEQCEIFRVPGRRAFPMSEVGALLPNPFGLYDVLGNVSEWCANPPYVYGTVPGTGPETMSMRATRGGSIRIPPNNPVDQPLWSARSSYRSPNRANMDDPTIGLRPARSIE